MMNLKSDTLETAVKLVEEAPALKKRKEPVTAAVWGFFLGGVGLGWYFRSWLDVFLPTMIWIGLAIVGIPTGELLLALAPFFCAIYGYRRAASSNLKLETVCSVAPPVLAAVTAEPERLEKLNALFRQGLISEAEYDRKRQEILALL